MAKSQPVIIFLLNTVTFDLYPPRFSRLLCVTAHWVGVATLKAEAPDRLKLSLIILEVEWKGAAAAAQEALKIASHTLINFTHECKRPRPCTPSPPLENV